MKCEEDGHFMHPSLLQNISQPRDLKRLNSAQIQQLCGEIRQFLLDSVSKTGGHLASNLGAVELTVALHRVFETPQDAFVFDVGHQCYTHKLLTGRYKRFGTLRQLDGLSGFPNPNESAHDAFIAGHGNTALSVAIGIAWAKKLKGEPGHVVAIIGDGAFTGGMVYEGMNNIGKLDNLLVILNDNKMSISHNVFALDNRVRKVQASLSDNTTHVLFCNSEGVTYYDYRPMVSYMAFCIMEENGRMENNYATRSYRKGFEFMTDDIIEVIAREVVDNTAIMFKAIKPKGGELPVVMASSGSGILLHEAIGHAFEADFNRKNVSIFADQLNKKVCNEHISVVDDGTIPFNRGSVNFDDEGIEGQKTYIVKDGVLTSYLHDRISSKHYGVAPTGNGRRDTFRNVPIPRMRATYMEAGDMKEEDIISTVKNGIYAQQFTNGQVQIGAGDFTFFVKFGYMIEDGKLTQPIKDINIIGNGPKALADITMVASNDQIDNGTWTCGKDGQSCPVTCGMPSALVSKLTVGGEN